MNTIRSRWSVLHTAFIIIPIVLLIVLIIQFGSMGWVVGGGVAAVWTALFAPTFSFRAIILIAILVIGFSGLLFLHWRWSIMSLGVLLDVLIYAVMTQQVRARV